MIQRVRRTGGLEAARAIMTTDLRPKQAAVQSRIGGRVVTIGGMVKGSGMIHPNMATMLAYFSTDALITRQALQQSLKFAAGCSFNTITVDGDTSTSDSLYLAASCLSMDAFSDGRCRSAFW